jgi:hypothetical protein
MAPPSKFRDGSRALYSCARTIKIEHPRFIRLGCSFVRLVQVYYTALRRESVEREVLRQVRTQDLDRNDA